MDHSNLIARITALDFIQDVSTADAAAKSVAGYLAGRLKELPATKLTQSPREFSTADQLGNSQTYVTTISGKELARKICDQFNLNINDSITLISTIFHSAKDEIESDIDNSNRSDMPGRRPDN